MLTIKGGLNNDSAWKRYLRGFDPQDFIRLVSDIKLVGRKPDANIADTILLETSGIDKDVVACSKGATERCYTHDLGLPVVSEFLSRTVNLFSSVDSYLDVVKIGVLIFSEKRVTMVVLEGW